MKKIQDLLRKRGIQRTLWIFFFLGLWEGYVRFFSISPLLFPSIEAVVHTLFEDLFYGSLFWQTGSSLGIIAAGLFLSLVLAFGLAVLSRIGKIWESMVDTITVIAHPLPGLALLPLIIMWFGTGSGAILAIVVHSALWPLLLNMITGFDTVPSIYTDTGKNLSMSKLEITFEIMVPASLGYIISGLKIGWARGWRAFISAEMVFGSIGGKGGIGWYIFNQRTFMDTAGLFAGIILVILIGIVVENVVFGALEKYAWHRGGLKC